MGEVFYKRIFVLFVVNFVFILSFSALTFAVHPLYSEFSDLESVVFNGTTNIVSANDTAVHGVGYYSINGSAWQNFNLSGNLYNSNSSWFNGMATYTLPIFGVGEHYVIVYSCTYNATNSSWNCHENKWQLIIINNTINSTVNNTVNNTNSSSCSDNCSSLGYQCGTQTICNMSTNCGSCGTGYSCNSTGKCVVNCTAHNSSSCYNGDVFWYNSCGVIEGVRYNCNSSQTCSGGACINSQPGTCGGTTCETSEYCSDNVCLLTVPGHTYFVSTTGNDNNPGNFTHPFATWQKAVQVSQPGDITYIRGGIWQPTSHVVVNGWETWAVGMYIDPARISGGRSGTAATPIRYYNYPGEKPILDGSLVDLDEGFNGGIDIEDAQYLEFKGLTIENIFQRPSGGTEAFGVGSFECANLKFENIIVHDIHGRGFQHWSGAWTQWGNAWDFEAYYPSNFQSDNTSWINCDAYNLFDIYSSDSGNAADGFIAHGHYGNYHSFEGCRAWNYSDDGINTFFEAYTTIKNCWVMSSHKYEGMGNWGIEGNGMKLNGVNRNRIPNYQLFGENFVKVENSIAANCINSGLINNIDAYVDPENWPSNGLFYNNLGYKNNAAFWDGGANQGGTRTTVYKNNIAYGSTSTSPKYEVGIYNPSIYPHSNNTWRAKVGEDWPGWEYTPAYTVNDADFVSLDVSQLEKQRKADGSLPDITFGHLKAGSDLIDAGTVIPSYHCATAGEHPGEDCVVWYGNAPDIGPFEYS